MKNVFFAILILLGLGSCKKDPDPTPQTASFKINGTAYTGHSCTATQYTFRTMGIECGGDSTNTPKIYFSIYALGGGITAPGTYSCYPYQTVFDVDTRDGQTHRSLYGTITITQLSPFKAYFDFTCQDSLKVTAGFMEGVFIDKH